MNATVEAICAEIVNNSTHTSTDFAPASRVLEGLIVGAIALPYDGYDSSQEVSYWGVNSYAVCFDGKEPVLFSLGRAGADNWHSPGSEESEKRFAKYSAEKEAIESLVSEYGSLADSDSIAQAQAWIDAINEARAIELANEERAKEISAELLAEKGRHVLVVSGDNAGVYGRCFWLGVAGGNHFHSARTYKVGLDAGGPRNERGYAAEPVWTARQNCVAIPSDCAEIFDASDAGNTGLAIAVAHLLHGRSDRAQYDVLQALAASQVAVVLLRALGDDLRRAQAEWVACPKKGKGSTAAKRIASEAIEAVSKRIYQIAEDAK